MERSTVRLTRPMAIPIVLRSGFASCNKRRTSPILTFSFAPDSATSPSSIGGDAVFATAALGSSLAPPLAPFDAHRADARIRLRRSDTGVMAREVGGSDRVQTAIPRAGRPGARLANDRTACCCRSGWIGRTQRATVAGRREQPARTRVAGVAIASSVRVALRSRCRAIDSPQVRRNL